MTERAAVSLWPFLLPARTDERVLVHGFPDPVRAAFRAAGVRVEAPHPTGGAGNSAAGRWDHALVALPSLRDPVLSMAAAGVRPGGHLLVVVRSGRRGRGLAGETASALRTYGVQPHRSWWVGEPWADPPWSLPAESPEVATWFLEDWFVPWSRSEVVTTRWTGARRGRGLGRFAAGLAVLGRRTVVEPAEAAC
jgi:hypothetical protein